MSTWKRVVPEQSRKGDLIEHGSLECQERIQYRWVNLNPKIDWICEQDFIKLKASYSGGQTFEKECDGNTTLTSGDTNPSGYEHSAMTSAVIGNCVTSLEIFAFQSCTGLTSVTIPDSVTSIGGYVFENCSGLTSVAIPNSVTSIGNYAFHSCSGLTSVTIPNSVTTIAYGVFQRCASLTSITIPSSVTSISNHAFRECSGLTSVTIPDSVTSIGNSVFRNCYGLTSVTIPNSVTSIGTYAFYNCTGLTSITVNATTPPTLGSSAFDSTNNCPIYVPCESVYVYKTATNWSQYADRIFPIT